MKQDGKSLTLKRPLQVFLIQNPTTKETVYQATAVVETYFIRDKEVIEFFVDTMVYDEDQLNVHLLKDYRVKATSIYSKIMLPTKKPSSKIIT